jgi:plasmid stabilization system protein ParE
MAKEIIWSDQALNDRKRILNYWILKNQSSLYSIRLDQVFREAVKLISEYPVIGKPTDLVNIRAKKVRDYFIFFRENENQIHILCIWDTSKKASTMSRIPRKR